MRERERAGEKGRRSGQSSWRRRGASDMRRNEEARAGAERNGDTYFRTGRRAAGIRRPLPRHSSPASWPLAWCYGRKKSRYGRRLGGGTSERSVAALGAAGGAPRCVVKLAGAPAAAELPHRARRAADEVKRPQHLEPIHTSHGGARRCSLENSPPRPRHHRCHPRSPLPQPAACARRRLCIAVAGTPLTSAGSW